MNVDPLNLPIRRLRFTLRLTAEVHLPVYHGHALHGLVTRALSCKPFPRQLAVYCCEAWSFVRQAGTEYRFGLIGLGSAGAELLNDAQSQIARRGRTPHRGGAGTLDGCYEVTACEELNQPPLAELTSALVNESGPVSLRFRTPLYLRRPRHNIRGGLSYINREEFPPAVVLRSLARRVAEASGSGVDDAATGWESWMPPIPDTIDADPSRMININFRPQAASIGSPNRTATPIEGVQGLVRLTGVPDAWLPFLAFGSVAQIGSSVGYGQGRYQVARGAAHSEPWCTPVMSLRDAAFSAERLASAGERVRENSDVRHDGWMPEVEVLETEVGAAITAVNAPAYAPAALHGALIPKKGGGLRALAIPSPAERVLQRAAYELLDADLDQLFEESSYAFRKGRSVKQAALAVRRAQRDGFGWVLDADISSFFDNVDWDVLSDVVDGTLAGDSLGPLLITWMRPPVHLAGHDYSRRRGLPQGSPLSPLLANLYLDALDEHLMACNFRVVRYADDFVVSCRSEEQARSAKSEAERELDELGLTLNDEKTHIVAPGEGFRFLGLQFGDSTTDGPERPAPASQGAIAIPPGSWLESVPMAEVRRVTEWIRTTEKRPSPPKSMAPRHAAAPAEERAIADAALPVWLGTKRAVVIVQRDVQIMLSGEKLVVRRADAKAISLPLRGISHLTLLGATRVSLPLALRCADLGVPVYCCRANGQLRGAIAPPPDWNTLRRQLERVNDEAFCLGFARNIVTAKLHNAATLLVRFDFADAPRRGAELRALRDSCANAESIEQVLGYEGRGARSYFEAWTATLAPEWGFTGRKKHPPPDPVNAMLSLAYTILYHHVGTALVASGLDPRVGVLHRERGLHQALASDVQEEFRFLAEGVVWNAVQRRQVTTADFVFPENETPVRMTDDARRLIARSVETRILEEFTPPEGDKQSYREFIDSQARAVAATFRATEFLYSPLRLKA